MFIVPLQERELDHRPICQQFVRNEHVFLLVGAKPWGTLLTLLHLILTIILPRGLIFPIEYSGKGINQHG